MGKVTLWIRALRAPFFTASAMSVVVGSAAAWHFGAARDYVAFVAAVVGVVFLHGGANLANDYWDHISGNDRASRYHNAFSGGSRVIQDGLLEARHVLAASVLSLALGSGCAAYLWASRGGWLLLLLAFSGLLAGVLYTSPPAKLSYRGLGEATIFAAFGPLVTMGAYLVQAGRIDAAGFWCGVPVGAFVALILFSNEFAGVEADASSGKKTLVVTLGTGRAAVAASLGYAAAYAAVGLVVFLGAAPRAALWTFATAPLAAGLVWSLGRNRSRPESLTVAGGLAIAVHTLSAAAVSAAYLWG